jgi:hypothetical protein
MKMFKFKYKLLPVNTEVLVDFKKILKALYRKNKILPPPIFAIVLLCNGTSHEHFNNYNP